MSLVQGELDLPRLQKWADSMLGRRTLLSGLSIVQYWMAESVKLDKTAQQLSAALAKLPRAERYGLKERLDTLSVLELLEEKGALAARPRAERGRAHDELLAVYQLQANFARKQQMVDLLGDDKVVHMLRALLPRVAAPLAQSLTLDEDAPRSLVHALFACWKKMVRAEDAFYSDSTTFEQRTEAYREPLDHVRERARARRARFALGSSAAVSLSARPSARRCSRRWCASSARRCCTTRRRSRGRRRRGAPTTTLAAACGARRSSGSCTSTSRSGTRTSRPRSTSTR